MAKKSNSYWDKRALERYNATDLKSQQSIERIKKIYRQAYSNIEKELESVYKNYSNSTGIDQQKLKELLTKSQTEKTFKQLKKQGLDKYIQNNYKARISRLEEIQAQIYGKAKLIYPKEELESTMCYKGILNDNYYRTIYDTQMGTGYNFSFSQIDKNMMNAVLSERWSGKNYSERIWKNTDILADRLSTVVSAGLMSGQGIEKTARQIRNEFNTAKYYAERLVRTESSYFHNQADMLAYQDLGVNKYVFVATLDNRTSEICQEMDNKKFDYDKIEVGVNFPPMHPNCRSTTRGYLGDEAERMLKRRARNHVTGKTEIVDNIPYSEWKKQYGNDNNVATIKKSNTGKDTNFSEKIKTKNREINVINSNYKQDKYNDSIKKIIESVEEDKLGLDYEVGTIIDKNTGVAERIIGEEHEIRITDEHIPKLKNNVFTHNHPMGFNFSSSDIVSFLEYDLYEIRASTDKGKVYSLRKGNGLVDSIGLAKQLVKDDIGSYDKVMDTLKDYIKRGIISNTELKQRPNYILLHVQSQIMTKWLNENATKFGFIYEEEMIW